MSSVDVGMSSSVDDDDSGAKRVRLGRAVSEVASTWGILCGALAASAFGRLQHLTFDVDVSSTHAGWFDNSPLGVRKQPC